MKRSVQREIWSAWQISQIREFGPFSKEPLLKQGQTRDYGLDEEGPALVPPFRPPALVLPARPPGGFIRVLLHTMLEIHSRQFVSPNLT